MIEALQAEWGVPGVVEISSGVNGLPRVKLTHRSGATAEIYLHGAHVTSWTTSSGEELFFLSRESHFAPGKPIRGGIPVIFPQFGGGVLPPHGLARTADWQLASTTVGDTSEVTATFRLTESSDTFALWPYPFRLELSVSLAEKSLTVAFRVTNTGDQPFDYQAVLHTYFAVADIRQAAVRGLQDITFIDDLQGGARAVETRSAIRIAEEVDRIYVDAPQRLFVDDEAHGRTITIEKHNMPDAVVWNPWVAKSQRMPDFGDDEYQRMVCVETGIMAGQWALSPDKVWQGKTVFSY